MKEEKSTSNEGVAKEVMPRDETMHYLERLLEPYHKLSTLENEEQLYELMEELEDNSIEIKRELKREYGKDISEVDDLTSLADLLIGMVSDVADGNTYLISAYGEDIGAQIGNISIEYLDGDLPTEYAKILGVDNLYDLE